MVAVVTAMPFPDPPFTEAMRDTVGRLVSDTAGFGQCLMVTAADFHLMVVAAAADLVCISTSNEAEHAASSQ